MSQTLNAVRSKYPQYKDIPDGELAALINEKYPTYSVQDSEFREEVEFHGKQMVAKEAFRGPSESETLLAETSFGMGNAYPRIPGISLAPDPGPPIHEVPFEPYFPIPRLRGETTLGKVGAGLANVGSSLVESVESPAGLPLLGMGGLPRWALKIAGLGFGAMMAPAAGERIGTASVTGDAQDITEAAGTTALALAPSFGPKTFGRDTALTRGDAARIIARDMNATAPDAGVFTTPRQRQLGIQPAEIGQSMVDALATPEAQAAVDLAYRQMQPGHIRLPWEPDAAALLAAQEPLVVAPTTPKQNVGGGKISFAAPAEARGIPNARQTVVVEIPRESLPAVEKLLVTGPDAPAYRRPTPAPTQEQAAARTLRGNVEKGLTDPMPPMEPIDPVIGQFPEEGMPTGTLSKLQRSRLAAGQPNVRTGVRNNPPGQNPGPELPPEPGGAPVPVQPKNPPATPNVTEGIDFANIQSPHRVGVERGMALTSEDVPVLEKAKTDAYDAAMAMVESKDPNAFKAHFGRGVYLEGVIEGARKSGPNYDAYIKERSSEAVPAEKVAAPGADFISTLERWKFTEDAQGRILNPQGQLFSVPHPEAIKAIGKGIWNNSIDVAILGIKAGKAVKVAIDDAIVYLKKNVPSFDEPKIRENLSKLMEMEGPRVEGTTPEMRKSAARATNSPQVPEPVQETIAKDPASFYKVQPMKAVEDTVSAMPDAELAAVPEGSNIHVASKLELSRRLFEAGKLDEGYEVFKSVSKTGTDFGQNINQFKLLKGQNPLNVVHIVNKGLKEAGRDPLTKEQAGKVAETAQKSIEANKSLESAKDAWLKDPTDANALLADAARKAADAADIATQREMAKFKVKNWPQMLKAFAQGNPLTPISQVANVVGNSLGAAMEAGSRGIAANLDLIRSAITGGERKVSVQPVRGTAAAAKGFGRGLAQAPGIMKRGSGDVVKGDTRAQLQPLRSLVKAFAKNPDVPTVGGKVPFNERVRLAVEGTFGIAPEVMLRMLSAADKPAYESARARLISEQSKLQSLPKNERDMAQKFPELFFDRETLTRINDESSAAVFQRESKTVSYLESLIKDKGGDWADLAFTLMVAPYRLTPWNLVGRTLIYNPLIAAMRTGIDAAKGNTRDAEINAGRMIVGGMLYTAGYFLYKNALIGPSLDDRDETQKARLLAKEVLPPNHVNIDGMQRLMAGGDPSFKPGDETWDLTRGGGAAGAILSSVANIGRDFEKKPESSGSEFVGTLLKNSTLEQASFTVNQSFLKGVTGIFDAVRNRNIEPYMNGVENMLLSVPTPNTLSTISRATRKYVPDSKADTMREGFENIVRNRFGVAGLDDYLPLKRDLWGKPMLQTPEGRNAILYHLFDISKNQQVTDDPVALELYDLWRTTSDTRSIPSIPTRQVTFGPETYVLNPKQYERYAELVGQYRRQITEVLVTNPNWQKLDDENKIKILDTAYDKGAEIGKALLLKETFGQMTPKGKKAGFK